MTHQEMVESISYAVDLVRDAMARADTREGRASGLYPVLLESAEKLIKARALAMGIGEVGRSAVAA